MNPIPLVSVIIPCYNYGEFLHEALGSILAQTYSNWECIIVNDGSTDNTEYVGQMYQNKDTRIKYIYQKNSGHSAARNTGLKVSKGKYIQFLDADDLLENGKINAQVTLMENNPSIDLVYSNILAFRYDDPNRTLSLPNFAMQVPVSGKGEILISNLITTNFFLPGCVIMRRTIYETIGNMKTFYGFEDWEYFSRMALEGFSFYHDSREGVRLLSGTHTNNTSHKAMEMIRSKIIVRKEIIKITNQYLTENKLRLNPTFIKMLMQKHKTLLVVDQVIFNLYSRNYFTGFKYIFLDAYYSGKPIYALFNGLKWTYYGLKKAFG